MEFSSPLVGNHWLSNKNCVVCPWERRKRMRQGMGSLKAVEDWVKLIGRGSY